MLHQSFDKTAICKVLTPEDVWRWNLWEKKEESEQALMDLAVVIKLKDFEISPFICKSFRGKPTYQAANVEDAIVIKLLDRYMRRIYKVRQSDRNRIISQIQTVLKDSGDYTVMRLDIKNCYESISFEKSIKKLTDDMILSPECIKLLNSIFATCQSQNIQGIPRGLAISPTLSELYLEEIDRYISQHEGVIYSSRYVDDIFILVDKNKSQDVKDGIDKRLVELDLELSQDKHKQFIGPSRTAIFDYLGYQISVFYQPKKQNKVNLIISDKKICKIKQKISISLNDYRKNKNLNLLKQRLNYLSVVKVIKKNENGTLLGGIGYSYRYVTDGFDCLKSVDGFFLAQLKDSRYGLNIIDQNLLSKKSFYDSVKNMKKGSFTKTKAAMLKRVWKNA